MSRLNVRLEKLEQKRRGVPVDMTEAEIQEMIQEIKSMHNLPASMNDMDVILNHSPEITGYLLKMVDGTSRILVSSGANTM